jgi:hypothetical protein
VVLAADIETAAKPAVSAINGKVQFGGGIADYKGSTSDELLYGAGSLSVPLGDMFGLQADFAAQDMFGETAVGGNVHLFTRDPGSHLFGVIAGYADAGKANTYWAGGEAEFYHNNLSLELAAGYLNIDPKFGSSKDKMFAFADVAFYPVENVRLAIGGSSVANFETGHATMEYLLDAMPVSLNLKAEVGEDKFAAVTAGMSFYFGGDDSSKSLMGRHREDDPKNRVLDIFGAGAAAFVSGAAVAVPAPVPAPVPGPVVVPPVVVPPAAEPVVVPPVVVAPVTSRPVECTPNYIYSEKSGRCVPMVY